MPEFDISALINTLPPEANLQLADPDLVNYYRDLGRRIYNLVGEISDDSVGLVKFIMDCNMEDVAVPVELRKPIIIMINSVGGSVEVMQSIIGAIKCSKTPVVTVNICTAYSAAAEILAQGHKGHRYALPNTNIMFHSGYSSFSGTTGQVDDAKKFFDSIINKLLVLLFENTKFDAKTQKKIKSSSDLYLNEDEAIKYGVIDHILQDFSELFLTDAQRNSQKA